MNIPPVEYLVNSVDHFLEIYEEFEKNTYVRKTFDRKEKNINEWRKSNRYYGKHFSILGDSLSTLEGFNPDGYSVYYSQKFGWPSEIKEELDTWWGLVIKYLGGELLVNNSWAGSFVTKERGNKELFPSGCSDERTLQLHKRTQDPDVIIIFMGMSDWELGVPIEKSSEKCSKNPFVLSKRMQELIVKLFPFFQKKCSNNLMTFKEEKHVESEENTSLFMGAYELMLDKVRQRYPNAEVWCATLNLPSKYSHGLHIIEDYNDVIRELAMKNACKLIDFYSYKIPYDSLYGTNPSKKGMNTLATIAIREMTDRDGTRFIDCHYYQEHSFVIRKTCTYGTEYVCKKCANTLYVPSNNDIMYQNEDGVYKADDGKAVSLFDFWPDNALVLYDVINDTDYVHEEEPIYIGKGQACNVRIDEHVTSKYDTISQIHTMIRFIDHKWYIRDVSSSTDYGTWLNGKKLKSEKQYELNVGDIICIANSVWFICKSSIS